MTTTPATSDNAADADSLQSDLADLLQQQAHATLTAASEICDHSMMLDCAFRDIVLAIARVEFARRAIAAVAAGSNIVSAAVSGGR